MLPVNVDNQGIEIDITIDDVMHKQTNQSTKCFNVNTKTKKMILIFVYVLIIITIPLIIYTLSNSSSSNNNTSNVSNLSSNEPSSNIVTPNNAEHVQINSRSHVQPNNEVRNVAAAVSDSSNEDVQAPLVDEMQTEKEWQKSEKKRKQECSKRRCCFTRSIYHESALPNNLKCSILTDAKCGLNDEFCEWDCNFANNHIRNTKFIRKFRGISALNGSYAESNPTAPTGINVEETYQDFVANSKFIHIDDCGVMYDETLPEQVIQLNWLTRKSRDFSDDAVLSQIVNDDLSDDFGTTSTTNTADRRRLDVIGPDDRLEVTSTAAQFGRVLYMLFTNTQGVTQRCTATMISKRWAMTAGHCVYGNGGFYSNFKLYKNVYSCTDKNTQNEYTVDAKRIFSGYVNGQTWDYDLGFVRIAPLDSGLGYFEFAYDTFSATKFFNIISHPVDKPDCSKWRQYCSYSHFYAHQMVTFDCDTAGGSSGSSTYLYYSTSQRRYVYGVHTKGACYLPDGTYQSQDVCNTATTLTSSKFSAVCGFIEVDEPDRCGSITLV